MTSDWHSKSGILTTDGCIGKTVAVIKHVKNKQSYMEHTCCEYEEDHPLDCLTPTEKTLLRTKVTTDIYPICWFVAQAHHIDSHTCYILKHLGYGGDGKGRERSKHWAVTQKLIMAQITKLRNRMLDRYRLLARGTCQQSHTCFVFFCHFSSNCFCFCPVTIKQIWQSSIHRMHSFR